LADFIRSPLLARHGVSGLFTLRGGGVSPVPFDSQNFGYGLGDQAAHIDKNLAMLVKEAALYGRPHQAVQVHQAGTLLCSGVGVEHKQHADILLCSEPNTPLAVRSADCLPILLADPQSGIIAAAHAGWRGTVAQVAGKAVSEMQRLGAKAERIVASLGPCIGPCCFEIGTDAAERLAGCCEGADHFITGNQTPHGDLWAINQLQLLQHGLKESHIELTKQCTSCNAEQFFSYRRDAGRTGRHLAVVALTTYP